MSVSQTGIDTPAVLIRFARKGDGETLLALIRELAEFEREADELICTAADLERDGFGPDPKFEALIAETNGRPVGYAMIFGGYSTWTGRPGIHIHDLYVTPAARDLGIGRLFMARIAEIALDRGCRRLDLDVLDWNPARRFYEHLGFRPLTDWVPYRLDEDGLRGLAASAKEDRE